MVLPISQSEPLKPGSQTHRKPLKIVLQAAPFKQGLLKHSFDSGMEE